MKTSLTLIAMTFLLTANVFAQTASPLPLPIIEAQELMVRQGTCEASWKSMAETVGTGIYEMDYGRKLYVVPCAMWAHNMAYGIYLVVPESTHKDGFIVKPIQFVSWSPSQGGLYATNVLHNVQFLAKEKSLGARFYLNGNEQCGSIGIYEWMSGMQNFKVTRLIKQDDCKSTEPWSSAL